MTTNSIDIHEARRLAEFLKAGHRTQYNADAAAKLLLAMAAEIERLRKDAERYRFLRQYAVDSYIARGSHGQLDSEIDAAMGEALVGVADAYMDEPVTERERAAVAAKRQRKP